MKNITLQPLRITGTHKKKPKSAKLRSVKLGKVGKSGKIKV